MSFYDEVLVPHPLFNSPTRVSEMDMLEPIFRSSIEAIMQKSEEAGIPLICFETYRSEAHQKELYQLGATRLKDVGVHHYGLACDLVKNVNGDPSWKGDFKFLGKLAKEYNLIWGGDWGKPWVRNSFVDAVHVQRINVSDQNKLFAGDWYPDVYYTATSRRVV